MNKHRITLSSGESFIISNEDQQKIIRMIGPSAEGQSQRFRYVTFSPLTLTGDAIGPQIIVFLDHITSIVPD